MSEFHIERGYREVYINDGDGHTSPQTPSTGGTSHLFNTRGPASAGVPQYKMGPPTYRTGVYLERDTTRPPRPAPTMTRGGDQSPHRMQVTYHVQDPTYQNISRQSPPPPPYSPPRHQPGYAGHVRVETGGSSPSRMYVYKAETATVSGDQYDANQPQVSPPSPSTFQERKDIETLVPMYTAAYPPGDRHPTGAPSKIVYTSHVSPQGQVASTSPGKENIVIGGERSSIKPQPHNLANVHTGPAATPGSSGSGPTQYRPPGRTDSSPRPYQLKPTMDSTPASPKSVEGGTKEAEVDALTNLLIQNMEVSGDPDFFGQCEQCGTSIMGLENACQALSKIYHKTCFLCTTCGMCVKCGRAIMGEKQGCSALDQLFHIECFSCSSCGLCLNGHEFFAMEGKPYCEPCYMNTLEKCCVCSKVITDRILRATGKPYHPECFMCVVCGKSLDGVQFTVDATNQIHCIEDFHRKFAPRCCRCDGPIMPETGEEETVRIVAMDQSFHVKCYKCEDCGLQLSSESDGRGCYPLDDHILCKQCNAKRIQNMTSRMMTEL